ncbi:hypothetical protein BC332_20596 [Capsicum chinense]|nr:hypothetical protein BC332_20596 [Capsicum chinense]
MKLSLVSLRSRTSWEKGENFSRFSIPPRTILVPYVKRIHIVYNDLGNLSSHYFNLSGYNILTSVIGFIDYDAPSHISTIASLRKIGIRPTEQPILIEFKNLSKMIKGRTTKLFGVALVVVVGRMVLGIFKSKKICEMEREAEEGEFLEKCCGW